MGERWYGFALREIDVSRRRMTDWERGFIEDIRPRIKSGLFLSEKQEVALRRIHEKMTGIGLVRR